MSFYFITRGVQLWNANYREAILYSRTYWAEIRALCFFLQMKAVIIQSRNKKLWKIVCLRFVNISIAEVMRTMAKTNPDSPKQNLSVRNFETRGRGTTSGGRPRKRSRLLLHRRQQQQQQPQPQQMQRHQSLRPQRADSRGCSHSGDLLDQVRHYLCYMSCHWNK